MSDDKTPWICRRPFGSRHLMIWRRLQVPFIGWPWWRIIAFSVGVAFVTWAVKPW